MAKEGGDRVRPSQVNRGSRPEEEVPTFPESASESGSPCVTLTLRNPGTALHTLSAQWEGG